MVEELLLGDNPFIGVSHLAQAKARESVGMGVDSFVKVVTTAWESGATGFTFSTHPTNLEILRGLAGDDRGVLTRLNYYPLVPYGMGYVRASNVTGLPGLGKMILKRSLTKMSSLGWLVKAAIGLNPSILLAMQLAEDLAPFMEVLPRQRVRAVLLHEVLTEVLVAHDAPQIYETLRDYLRSSYGVEVGLETRNIHHLKLFMEKHGLRIPYIMTPMNPLGYQMTPDRERAEKAIRLLGGQSRIIAINILASGALSLEEAIKYILKFDPYGVAVGTSKAWRARENFKRLRDAVTGRS